MRTTLLIGPPGSGKTTMLATTVVNPPCHVIDIDGKIGSMANLHKALDTKALTYWELGETLVEDSLGRRAQQLAAHENPERPPKGWLKFADLVEKLEHDEDSKRAGTWAIDSLTMLGWHLKRKILYDDKKGTAALSPKNWGAYLNMWVETMSILKDLCRVNGKDLICTVHERMSEIPGPNTKIIKVREGDQTHSEYVGMLDYKIAASIEGQFGLQMGAFFEEVYGLSVVVDDKGGDVRWVCRVLPDGRRDLRNSFSLTKPEYPPDFRVIWSGAAKEETVP